MKSTTVLPPQDRLNRFVGFSIAAHVILLVVFTVKAVFFSSDTLDYQSAVQVDLVALPDKALPDVQKPATAPAPTPPKAEPEPPKKSELEAKIEKAPVVKSVPKDLDAVNLNKTKAKEKAAMNKLKQMSALDKLKDEMDNDKPKPAPAKPIKGNALSSGSQLTGLSRLQADSFIGDVERQIRSNWVLPQWLANKDLSAQIRVRFDEKGNIISATITKSSGNPAFDDVVVETVQKSAPLPAPPEKFVRLMAVEGILFGFPQ